MGVCLPLRVLFVSYLLSGCPCVCLSVFSSCSTHLVASLYECFCLYVSLMVCRYLFTGSSFRGTFYHSLLVFIFIYHCLFFSSLVYFRQRRPSLNINLRRMQSQSLSTASCFCFSMFFARVIALFFF